MNSFKNANDPTAKSDFSAQQIRSEQLLRTFVTIQPHLVDSGEVLVVQFNARLLPALLFLAASGRHIQVFSSPPELTAVATGKIHFHSTTALEWLGVRETEFNEQVYLSQNSDVAQAVSAGRFDSGREHYILHGRHEGRPGGSQKAGGLPDFHTVMFDAADTQAVVPLLVGRLHPKHRVIISGFEGRESWWQSSRSLGESELLVLEGPPAAWIGSSEVPTREDAPQPAAVTETVGTQAKTDGVALPPDEKRVARQKLGLPGDRRVVLCTAPGTNDRQGQAALAAIAASLHQEAVFVTLGERASYVSGGPISELVREEEIQLVFKAADVLLNATEETGLRGEFIEAQTRGLPVISVQTTEAVEILRNEITGKIVPPGKAETAVHSIRSILGDGYWRGEAGSVITNYAARHLSAAVAASEGQRAPCKGACVGTGHNPPIIHYPRASDGRDDQLPHRPSWPGGNPYVSAQHRQVFSDTSGLPGWQMRGDTEKLYEMGYHAGDVILEIGTFGGRSAAVELLGALANPDRTQPPQFYGIDIAPDSIARTRHTLIEQRLADYCHLYEGTLAGFIGEWTIVPTMVFLDGDHRYEGVAADLAALSRYLKPGTPVLMHDYLNPENDSGQYGVRRAALDWSAAGHAKLIGCFGCSALYLTQEFA